MEDTELAGFGEANYQLTSALKLTAGVRVSKVDFKYTQVYFGPLAGWLTPTVANTGLAAGNTSETPVTPKIGGQYQVTPNDMVYFTVAKGYRPGGVNAPLSPQVCTGLATFGLTTSDLPKTYNSDQVWSYEAGAKIKLFDNRLQLNTSAYRIDWTNVQLSLQLPACQAFVSNAGGARSQGFDLDAQAHPFSGFTADVALGYNNAEYTQSTFGPVPLSGAAPTLFVNKGDKLPIAPWTVNLGGRYDFTVASRWNAYLRADYFFTSAYLRSFGPGATTYDPDNRNATSVTTVNLRLGVDINRWNVNIFANNALDSEARLTQTGGRTGCTVASGPACTGFSVYDYQPAATSPTPRTVGVQASYRY